MTVRPTAVAKATAEGGHYRDDGQSETMAT